MISAINQNYKKAFYYALALHLFLVAALMIDHSTSNPAMSMKSSAAEKQPTLTSAQPQQEVVKAVSVDSKEILETMNKLKQEQARKQQAEINKQRELNRQIQLAKQQRIKEQQHVAQLKEEANRIAIARKKQAEEEKKHLEQLAEQKIKEAKKIEELKKQQEKLLKQQELEAKKQAENLKKKTEAEAKAKIEAEVKAKAEAETKAKAAKLQAEQKRLEKARTDKALAEKAQADAARKKQEVAENARIAQDNAEHQMQMAGEIDKYKALILNAIAKNWILPEQVDSTLSCQFQIRLAPDGTVMQVTLTSGSGDPLLDRSARTAIYKASPLPVPKDIETFSMFRDISLTVRPEQVRG